MKVPDLNTKTYQLLQSNAIRQTYPEFYDYINNKYPNDLKWMEKLYWYKYKLTEKPKCRLCGKPTSFKNFYDGYQEFCSRKCANKVIYERNKQYYLKKYGTTNYMATQEFKDKVAKTVKEKYGTDNVSKIPEVQKKKEETCMKHFGTTCIFSSKEGQERIKQTLLKLYGVDNPTKSPEIIKKMQTTNLKRYGNVCTLQNPEVRAQAVKSLYEHYGVTCAFDLVGKKFVSKDEIELQDYIEQIGYQIVRNDRNTLKDYELDIYIPNLKIAIEYNGSYWHSLLNKDRKYHMNKWLSCYNANIELISIWEPWNTNIVYQFIKDKLKGSDISIYKDLLFPDLDDKKWPLDLGYLKDHKINLNKIKEHLCVYAGFECCDSGYLELL